MSLDIRVLGPLEIRHDLAQIAVGTPKQRTVLALLLLHANEPVTTRRMVDELWPGGPPNSSTANVTTYLSRLRRVLATVGCSLDRRQATYVLTVPPGCVDLRRFAELAALGDQAWTVGDAVLAASLWAEASAVWRGELFDAVPAGAELAAARVEWGERRIAVYERYARAQFRLGHGNDIVAELRRHTCAEPLRETGWLLLMAALWSAGNPAAALEAYEQARVVLAEQLGADPGPRLRRLHQAILTGDEDAARTALDDSATARPAAALEPVVAMPAVVPAQLPPDVSGFAGRGVELAALDAAARNRMDTVVVITVVGTAGVGKTSLAVHWAHRVADRFPDGQIYLDLRGFDPGSEMTPQEALRVLLQALGMTAASMPTDLGAQIGMYRSLLAGRRLLLVLDNVRDADQVRPLLPGSAECVAIVTSRNALIGLVAVEGALPLRLDLLSAQEAADLLRYRLGPARVVGDDHAIQAIIARCVGLPLALAIVAARAATRPELRLSALAEELSSKDSPLDALAGGDPSADARTVFSWSYHALSPMAAHLFRALGRHPGPGFSLAAAASLLGLPVREARFPLDELVRAHLLTESSTARYTLHDLLRDYSAELADATEPVVFHRLVDHYVHSAAAASRLLETGRDPIEVDPPLPGVSVAHIIGRQDALAWFVIEHPVLMAVARAAAHAGLAAQAWTLTLTLAGFLDNQGHWPDWREAAQLAVDAAQQLSDPAREARAQRVLARGCVQLGRYAEAETHYLRALTVYADIDDLSGQAATHFSLSWMMELQGRHDESLHHSLRSLDLYQSTGHLTGQARALNSVGWSYALLENYPQTLDHCTRALALQEELGDLDGQAATWDSIGYAHHQLGRSHDAIPCYERSVQLYRRCGDRLNEADVLTHLGDARETIGDRQAAHTAWHQAAEILEVLGHADAEQVRAKLRAGESVRIG